MSSAFILWCYYLTINVVLETDKIFTPGKMQGLFQNVFLIVAALLLYPKYGVRVLLYAFLLSGLAQCILVTWCARKQFKFVFHKINAGPQIKHLIALSIPLIIGSAIYEINDIVDKQISTGLGSGNVSYLTYGAARANIVKVFYAFQDTKKPMINGAIAVGTNIVLSILLSKVIGVSGIAVATSIAMLLVTVLLAKDVKKYLPGLSLRRCVRECVKGAIAGLAVTAVVWLMHEMITMNLYLKFITEGIVCVGLYVVLMYLLKSKCIKGIAWKAMGLVKR